jgi:uncharacterized protein YkuJ
MNNFSNFLIESLDVDKLKHLEHAEDHIIHGGQEGFEHTSNVLADVLSFLEGKPRKNFNQTTKITTKWDGAPSIVFGVNPENGKFFVATKSAFNVNPKINYTDEDIERNHGHAPGLVEKLKAALEELPKIMPKGGGVYQGDLMYTKPDLQDKDKDYSFTPNTITYSTDKNSAQGRKISASNLGIVVHTKYTGKKLSDMKAGFDVDQSAFKQDPLVNVINPEVDNAKISPMERKEFQKKLEKAAEIRASMEDDIFNVLDGHDILMKTYINSCIRNPKNPTPTAAGYRRFLLEKMTKEVASKKSPAGQQKIHDKYDTVIQHLESHKDQFENIFKLHKAIQQAKDVLVRSLSKVDTGFKTTIGGKEVKPEGFVATRGGRPTKLVDRAEFSASNFAQGAFRNAEPEPVTEKPKSKVFTFGRMNPPTIGHKKLSDRVQEIANEEGAEHEIVLSRSQDEEKNPLSPEQKEKHAKVVLGNTAKVRVADKSEPTLIHQAKRYEKEGVKHLILVVGSDRVEEMKKLLDKYNGSEFKFDKIDVVSAGDRDPDAEGVEGMSASKMREHAGKRRFNDFAQGLPKHVTPAQAMEMYNDVRKGMEVKIDANTSGISLARYAKRKDAVGVKARNEQKRRLMAKEAAKRSKGKKPAVPVVKPVVKPVAPSLVQKIVAKKVASNG